LFRGSGIQSSFDSEIHSNDNAKFYFTKIYLGFFVVGVFFFFATKHSNPNYFRLYREQLGCNIVLLIIKGLC